MQNAVFQLLQTQNTYVSVDSVRDIAVVTVLLDERPSYRSSHFGKNK